MEDILKEYRTLGKEASAEMIEKKSRFIGYACPVKEEEEALAFIKAIRKKHADATHNVYAYLLREKNIMRYSDDGEPKGTAGVPVFEVIRKSGICDAVVVVTRYFGGILLGAGGLVRAYSEAAKLACNSAGIVSYTDYTEFLLKCNYSDYQKISYDLPFFDIIVDKTDFSDYVILYLAIKEGKFASFQEHLSKISSGVLCPEIIGHRLDKI